MRTILQGFDFLMEVNVLETYFRIWWTEIQISVDVLEDAVNASLL